MSIRSLCNTCFQTYELRFEVGDGTALALIAGQYSKMCPCPRHCGGQINIVNDPGMDAIQAGTSLRQPLVLTGSELFAALNGMPLPDEVPKDRLVITALLKGAKVKDVVVQQIDSRFFLHEIVLDSGVVVHLSSGRRGAEVLKITKEFSRAV